LEGLAYENVESHYPQAYGTLGVSTFFGGGLSKIDPLHTYAQLRKLNWSLVFIFIVTLWICCQIQWCSSCLLWRSSCKLCSSDWTMYNGCVYTSTDDCIKRFICRCVLRLSCTVV